MAYIHVVMSLIDFVPYIQDILNKYSGTLYVQKKEDATSFYNEMVDITNYKSVIDPNREKYSTFFISSKKIEDKTCSFYDDSIFHYVIDGLGGRETEDYIETIALRLVSKNPDKEIKKIFTAIRNKLKKDESFGRGIEGDGSSICANFFYKKSYVGNKILIHDLHLRNKTPIIPLK